MRALSGSQLRYKNGNRSLLHIKVYDGKGKKLSRMFRVKIWPTPIIYVIEKRFATLCDDLGDS